MKLASLTALGLLVGCQAEEEQQPLDIDIVVNRGYVEAYLNGSDLTGENVDASLVFPALGACSHTTDVGFITPSCVRTAAFVGGGHRYPPRPGFSLSALLPSNPDDLALELEGCGWETTRIPIGLPSEARSALDVVFGKPVHVAWSSDRPVDSALVSYWAQYDGDLCRTSAATHELDTYYMVESVSVTPLEAPAIIEGSWGTARVWRAGNTSLIRETESPI